MKKLVVLLMLSLFASSAFAVVDPDPNSVGFYFDMNADVYESQVFAFTQAYLIVTNPTFEAIKGLECQLDWDEATCMFYGILLPAGALNVGDHHSVIIGLGSAMATSPATVMATYNLMPMAATHFTLGALETPSIPGVLPVVVDGDDNMFQIGLSAGVGNVCTMIGDTGVVDAESETWGGVKSLYR